MSAPLLVVYAALAVLLTWILVDARGDWRPKAVVIVVAPTLAFALWLGRQQPEGWPTQGAPPSRATFAWGLIDEPSASDHGAIFLWLVPADSSQPRAYRLPYSRELHKQTQAAIDAVKHGIKVGAARKHAKRAGGGKRLRAERAGPNSPLVFYPQPPTIQPAKP